MTTATAVGYVEMRIAKVVGLHSAEDEPVRQYVVLEEVAGDRHLAIAIGQAEAFTLAAHLGGISWPRPMTYQFVAALVQALGGHVRQVQIDRVVEETYIATVKIEGPPGVQSVDARPSDALNLTALVQARSSPRPGCCRGRGQTRRGFPHGSAPASGAGSSTDDRRHSGDVGQRRLSGSVAGEWHHRSCSRSSCQDIPTLTLAGHLRNRGLHSAQPLVVRDYLQ